MHPVVAPVAGSGELADRHQLDGGHAKIDQRGQVGDHRLEGPLLGEGADVQLIDNQGFQRMTPEGPVSPGKIPRVDDHRRPVHAFRLPAGNGVWPVALTVEPVLVPAPGTSIRDEPLEETVGGPERYGRTALEHDLHRPTMGRPHPELGSFCLKACTQAVHTVQL